MFNIFTAFIDSLHGIVLQLLCCWPKAFLKFFICPVLSLIACQWLHRLQSLQTAENILFFIASKFRQLLHEHRYFR